MSFIDSLETADGKIVLTKYDGSDLTVGSGSGEMGLFQMQICFLDLETTGKNRQADQIIELALKRVLIDKDTGRLVAVSGAYESLNEPGIPISEEASQINGITAEMVAGKHIDWDIVQQHIEESDLIVSHNASFDRAFLDRILPLSRGKTWACTINDIDWLGRGFNNAKQELLCVWHGFYYDSHRAMGDVDALIHLVTHESYPDEKPLKELILNSTRLSYKISAVGSPFETKDILKANNYSWDNIGRVWWKAVSAENLAPEKQWLTEIIYSGYFRGRVEEIGLADRYKD